MNRMAEWRRLNQSFRYAIMGIVNTFKKEKNMRIHGWAGVFVLLLSYWAGIPVWQYLIFLFIITWIWSLELINTAIEKALDFAGKESSPLIKTAKDAAAGAVLISSCFAVIIGFYLLFKPLKVKVSLFYQDLMALNLTLPVTVTLVLIVLLLQIIIFYQKHRAHYMRLIPTLLSFFSFLLFFLIPVLAFKVFLLLLPPFLVILYRRNLPFLIGLLQAASAGILSYLVVYYFLG